VFAPERVQVYSLRVIGSFASDSVPKGPGRPGITLLKPAALYTGFWRNSPPGLRAPHRPSDHLCSLKICIPLLKIANLPTKIDLLLSKIISAPIQDNYLLILCFRYADRRAGPAGFSNCWPVGNTGFRWCSEQRITSWTLG
jgi:hypothetical protein